MKAVPQQVTRTAMAFSPSPQSSSALNVQFQQKLQEKALLPSHGQPTEANK